MGHSYANVSNISSQHVDRLSQGDMLIIPTQCTGKYIMYSRSLAVCYFRYPYAVSGGCTVICSGEDLRTNIRQIDQNRFTEDN